jgi:23S rRNA pseudoU1915 N3-methylase RlmH
MNGAIADPAVRTISTPKVSKITISGNNQNFFLTRRNPQRSLMNSIISFFLSTSFDESLQKRAFMKLSLSKMIFTHQMVRMILLEQVYRALTILKNEKYHH